MASNFFVYLFCQLQRSDPFLSVCPEDDVLVELVEVLNREHHGIVFTFDKYYKTEGDTSFGGKNRGQALYAAM